MATLSLPEEKKSFILKVREAGREPVSTVPIYDLHAHEYNEMYGAERWAGPAAVAEIASNLLKSFPRALGDVLDFGCGTGLTGCQLRAKGALSVHGLDPSSGMLAMVPAGVYDKTFSSLENLRSSSTASSKYSIITSTAVIGTHVGPETVAELVQNHLKPHGHMIFTLKTSFYTSPEFTNVFESLMQQGYQVTKTKGQLLHTDDETNEHTIVTISDKRVLPRRTIVLWSTPRSMSTAVECCISGHPQVGYVMHDIFSAPEFGLTDIETQEGEYDGTTPATYEQVLKHVENKVFDGETSVLFIKTIARCAGQVSQDKDYWTQPHFKHAFLVEAPEWVLPSVYARLQDGVAMEASLVCYESLSTVIDALGGDLPLVVRAEEIRKTPEVTMKQIFCHHFGLDPSKLKLKWAAKDNPRWYRAGSGEDESLRVGTDGFQEYHSTVRSSTTFNATRKVYEQNTQNNKELADLEKEVMPFYDKIVAKCKNAA